MEPLTVLSMGWGVQTWTMAAMMALDEMPRADFIVFADTHHESVETYDFIRKWAPWLGEHGLNVVTVKGKRTDVVREDWSNSVLIPAFTVEEGTGKRGQVRRQCTHDWKIIPVRQFIRKELADRATPIAPGAAECWLGISWDEALKRVRDSDVAYVKNVFPLVEHGITRADCVAWLEETDLPVPPKSACTFCPYKSLASWKGLKQRGGPDWDEAVEVDQAIRNKRDSYGLLYVHPARVSLAEAVSIPEDFGAKQLGFEDASCDSGYCFT